MPQTQPQTQPTPTPQQDTSPERAEHQFILDDLDQLEKRAAGAKYLEAKTEFSEQTYPFLRSLVEHFGERMDRLEETMDELITQSESLIQPGLAVQIIGTLNLGRAMADAVSKVQPGISPADVKRLHQIAAAYLTACEATSEAVEEAAVPEEPGMTDGDDDDEEEADAEGASEED